MSLLNTFKRALVLAPHTDDEFGCAGTVIRLKDAGVEVKYVAFSDCKESIPAGYDEDTLVRECNSCLSVMGLTPMIYRFPVRRFTEHRQDILEEMVKYRKEINPDLVLLPSGFDRHQDHAVIAAEGFRAFKHCTILGYELPQNIVSFNHGAFIALSEDVMDRKIAALKEYKSQAFRPYASEEFIRGLATVRGVQIGVKYAEAFEMIRLTA